MKRPRKRRGALPKVWSLSCTDAEWERVRGRAARRGLSISRYLVERGLTVDLAAEAPAEAAPPGLALTAAEQRELYDRVALLAECMAGAGGTEGRSLRDLPGLLAGLVDPAPRDTAPSPPAPSRPAGEPEPPSAPRGTLFDL